MTEKDALEFAIQTLRSIGIGHKGKPEELKYLWSVEALERVVAGRDMSMADCSTAMDRISKAFSEWIAPPPGIRMFPKEHQDKMALATILCILEAEVSKAVDAKRRVKTKAKGKAGAVP